MYVSNIPILISSEFEEHFNFFLNINVNGNLKIIHYEAQDVNFLFIFINIRLSTKYGE